MTVLLTRVSAIVVTLGALLWGNFFSSSQKPVVSSKNINTDTITTHELNESFLDNDKDGLKNWQEKLWGTDLEKADSDNDGTLDGEEVKENRNPLKKPPDVLTSYPVQNIVDVKNILETTSGSKNNAEPVQKLPQEVPDATNNTLKKYGNELGILIKSHEALFETREKTVFDAVATNAPLKTSDFKLLNDLADGYERLALNINSLTSPLEAKSTNESLAMGYKNLGGAFRSLASYKNGTPIPFEAFENYEKIISPLIISLQNTFFLFKNNGVSFRSDEPGAIFNLPF